MHSECMGTAWLAPGELPVRLSRQACISQPLTPFLRKILASLTRFISSFQKRGQECFCFQTTIAKYLRCSVRTVQRAIAELVRRGLAEVQRRGRAAAILRVLGITQNQQQNEQPAALSGGSSGGSKQPLSINESVSVLNIERREMYTPSVVFLHPESPKTPPPKKKTAREAVIDRIAAWWDKEQVIRATR